LLNDYYQLVKPGIIYANLLTAAAGYLLATHWHINWRLLAALLAGVTLVIASACVFNNCLDRGIDEKMQRTRHRALVAGLIPVRSAIAYAVLLGGLGFTVLVAWTNWLTVLIGVVAFVDYVVLYGLAKRLSRHGTLVGTVAGSASVVAGYCAATGRLDTGALILFLILACWQMSHFYAIAVYRLKDYQTAGLPVWPAKSGLLSAKRQIVGYILVFLLANTALSLFGYTGYTYLAMMLLLSLYWLQLAVTGIKTDNDRRWGRRMFLRSLLVMLGLSVMLAVGPLLP
jgi:heme o synthase